MKLASAIRQKKDSVRKRVVYYDARKQEVIEHPAVVEERKCPICALHNHLRDYCRYYKKWDTAKKRIVGCRKFKRDIM